MPTYETKIYISTTRSLRIYEYRPSHPLFGHKISENCIYESRNKGPPVNFCFNF